MAIGAVTARIITQYSDKGSKAAARDINKLGKNFDKFAGRVGKAFGLAAAASAAFAIKIGVDSVKAAIADEKSQALLANSLRNTTGATDAAIAATESYIDQTQRAFGVVDDDLRPALAKLSGVTGEIASAQGLLGVALNLSAGAGIELTAAVGAITKASQGNFGALTKMGVPIDENIRKTKDFAAVLGILDKQFGGAAATRANTFEFRMKRLGIAFDEAKETLGTALMPTLEELFQVMVTKVIPAIQTFLTENGDKLVAVMTQAIKAIVGFGFAIFKVFAFVAKHKEVFVTLGAILAATFVAGKVIAFVTAIQGLIKAFMAMRAAAIGAAAATAAATGGISVAAAAAGVAAFAATLGGLYLVTKKANSEMNKMEGTSEDLEFSFDGLNGTTDDFLNSLGGMNVNLGKAVKNTKTLTAADLKLIATQKALAALRKFGIKPTSETDPIQLEAARLNLIKQANIAEAERVQAILGNLEAQLKANDAIKRYTDLLGVVADSKISAEEVIVLSQKWGISKEAVIAYTTAIFAVNDGKISTKEVGALATQWNVTTAQAMMYLEFFAALNDGKLDDTEINKLAEKWALTNKEVADYAKKIATPGVTPSTIWPAPGDAAAQSWRDALTALNAYVAASGAKIAAPTVPAPVAGTPLPPGFTPQFTSPPQVKPGEPGFIGPVAPKPVPLAPLERSLGGYGGLDLPITPSPAITPEAYANLYRGMGSSRMPALAAGGIVTSPTTALIGEAGPEAVIPLNRMGSMGGATVNIVINGSVTSEGDLVNAIRNAILQGQNNGQAITKTAIQL
jgi:hypothetical protein